MASLRLGAILLQTRPWADSAEQFRQIEAIGYDVAYVADHLTHPTMAGQWLADGWATLAGAALVTDRIDVGTLVASAAVRNPVPLARAAATIDDMSGGRLVLGLGAGTPADALADGRPTTVTDLVGRYADVVERYVAVLRGEHPDVQTAPLAPGRRPPFLLLAAHGPRSFDLVGRFADGWSSYGGPQSVTLAAEDYWRLVAEQKAAVDAACERHGRDPASLRRSLLLGYGTVQPVTDVAAFLDAAERTAAAGFDEMVVYWPFGDPDGPFRSDPQVHADAVAALRAQPTPRG